MNVRENDGNKSINTCMASMHMDIIYIQWILTEYAAGKNKWVVIRYKRKVQISSGSSSVLAYVFE